MGQNSNPSLLDAGQITKRTFDADNDAIRTVPAEATSYAIEVSAADGDSVTTYNYFSTRSDTYTGTGNGTSVNNTSGPTKSYSIQVKGTGASATSWDVRLEGSLDGTNWSQILQHINTSNADGATVFSGSSQSPALYIRSRCHAVSLGSATNIVVTILGIQ